MATLTMAQAYAYARQAGFDPASAVIAAAIAMGESGLNPAAIGDVSLQDATWGPSIGLMQIRTLKRDTGTGRVRDIETLRDPLQNMLAAFKISSGGKDWTPWTVYNTGKYRQFLSQAEAAGGGYVPGVGGVATQPVGVVDDFLGGLAEPFLAEGKKIAITLLIAAGGVTLVLLGTAGLWGKHVKGWSSELDGALT